MAKTSVVNPRRRRKSSKKRRRNYGAASSARKSNPRRRRRRHSYGAAPRRSHKRRRRNPSSSGSSVQRVYSGGGYRRPNPGMFDFDSLTDTLPSATAGVWAARWAVNQAGDMEGDEPGIKHALAIWLAASFGSEIIGQVFGSAHKGEFARIAALGWGGDLFARKRFFKDSKWVKENLYLAGVDEADDTYQYGAQEGGDLNGFQSQSALGDSFVDAVGNQYTRTPAGWALSGAGMGAQLMQDAEGNVYQLGAGGTYQYPQDYNAIMQDGASGFGVARDPAYGTGARLAGFQSMSALGAHRVRAGGSSFGYA